MRRIFSVVVLIASSSSPSLFSSLSVSSGFVSIGSVVDSSVSVDFVVVLSRSEGANVGFTRKRTWLGEMLNRLPGNPLDLNRLPIRRELPPTMLDDCNGRTDVGRITRAFPLGETDDGDVPPAFNVLVFKRENLFEPVVLVTNEVAACGALLKRLVPPAKRRVLVSALPFAGVARIVGVKSV